MVSPAARPLRSVARRISGSAILVAALLLAVLTVASAWLLGWQAAVVGLVVMHLGTLVVILGPWSSPPPPRPAPKPRTPPRASTPAPATKAQLARLEQRVDALGARVVASTERLRVEVLEAVTESDQAHPERQR